ncbi:hypothetical protein ASC89_00285 [Devosia sp. Root413D1]|uniref:hypothetical protein n=1 Tax=Devosia sp. Root413D1 TaxID=1736531 RepID=UPI00070219A1|nr:hypothetical protein [Devosia sp. Root413D1]KQW85562.1 hypothetical protein ASC89_00285 [Devosia sp. Root413D1]
MLPYQRYDYDLAFVGKGLWCRTPQEPTLAELRTNSWEAMSTALAVLTLILIVAFIFGIALGLFFRGRRKRGWLIAAGSFVAFVATFNVSMSVVDREAVDQGFLSASDRSAAKAAGYSDPATWQTKRAEVASASEKKSEPVAPTEIEQEITEVVAVAASKFGTDALSAYCDGYHKTIAVIREADDKFGIEGTDEKMDWINERDEAIGRQTEKAIGVPATEWLAIASAERWDQRCEGLARGWLLIEDADLLAAGDGDAHVVTRALQAAYEGKVKAGSGLPFSRYRSATCNWKELEGYHFAACTLTGGQNGFRSDPYLFFVGSKAGAPVIVPLDNDHMTEPSYRDIDTNKTVVPVGWYVGPQPFIPVPYTQIRALFE